ncbi:PhzF family phenazine biosynthesis protein [Tengunoibacter tsumagoiensis]|uniref:Phenazine biosynthesis protein n=1 Tax=Tengunoibacter tsumagoiensis TaxID=2014871 RepID=A0A402A308_9CHLR|nr:PhzF family phenazine biosynthesis protein [Tengunoibacter tsumagoiensis]GCE13533.1 phenazine biosynthesis protein [Tengunoibacter tsumagoiensis]
MGSRIVQVDAFTNTPFGGNPAAVCLLDNLRDDRWMQHIAQEMNLSETAFLLREGKSFRLRWFTPAVEVKLCGHATLASAHVLWEEEYVQPNQTIYFETQSGQLTAQRHGEWIELNFPATPETAAEAPAGLLEALGVSALYVGKTTFDYLVEVESEDIVRAMQPNFSALIKVPARGVIVTSRARPGSDYDFVSRFFGPQVGVNEDPVTGSAHCCLAPYWSARLGRTELTGYQASARGGIVRVRLDGDRVHLGGQAVTIMRGELAGR